MANPFDPLSASHDPFATNFAAPAPAAAPPQQFPGSPGMGMPPPGASPTAYGAPSPMNAGTPQSQQYPPQQYGQQPYTPTGAQAAASPMALVPATGPPQASSQWGMPQQAPGYPGPNTPGSVASGGSMFDPLAPPPAAPPAPPPPPPPAQQQQPAYDQSAFPTFDQAAPPAPQQLSSEIVESQRNAFEHPGDYGRETGPSGGVVSPGMEARNKYSRDLGDRAPVGASPLPKAELVRKSGWVLSRISFRTILTKKWKQSYWVQYGSHTMLWFRSQQDFDDWLNNPYHNQAQRNFLIKLAVNFVHDLYKPNVRGYQVTQCRVKPYGNKMVRQFKLERWMDYGPTIAAAFGAYDPKEVDELRAAIVECMKNTPLEGGVRATGAIREHHEQEAAKNQGENGNFEHTAPTSTRSVASATDLLDDQHNSFEDSASYPGGASGMDPAQQAFNAYNPQSYPAPAPGHPAQAPAGYPAPAPGYPAQAPTGYPAPAPAQAPPQAPQGYPQQQQYQQQPYQQYQQPMHTQY